MKKLRRNGFIAVEAIVTAALILTVGLASIISFSTTGSRIMDEATNRLIDLGLFPNDEGPDDVFGTIEYNGCYPTMYNITEADINSISDFE